MFEKEAEKHCNETLCSVCENPTCTEHIKCREWRDRRAGFYCGATFGYNKANEWHYVKDGDLPKEGISVLVMLENGQPDISGVSKDNRWFCTDYYTGEDKVITWKEIVLPKESE